VGTIEHDSTYLLPFGANVTYLIDEDEIDGKSSLGTLSLISDIWQGNVCKIFAIDFTQVENKEALRSHLLVRNFSWNYILLKFELKHMDREKRIFVPFTDFFEAIRFKIVLLFFKAIVSSAEFKFMNQDLLNTKPFLKTQKLSNQKYFEKSPIQKRLSITNF